MIEEEMGITEVHPPHRRINSVGEFFLHLFTITIGLLIALALENAASAVHHRHQREEAETTIRKEMADNRAHLAKADEAIQGELRNMNGAVGYLEQRSRGNDASAEGLSLGFNMIHLQNAGWRMANATGVLQYMDYDDVQRFAESYDEQDVFNGLQSQTLENYLKLNSYFAANKDPKHLSRDEIDSALSDVRTTIAHLGAMQDVGRELMASYDDALKQ
jgi:hypothetical protein